MTAPWGTGWQGGPNTIPGQMPVYPGKGGLVPRIGPEGGVMFPEPPKGQPIVFPWWLYEMPGSTDWELNVLNFTATGSATTTVAGFSRLVPAGNQSVLKQLILTVQNPLASLNLLVRLLINGAPVQGWSSIAFPPAAATAIILPYNDMIVRMSENQTLTAQFIEGFGTTYTCSITAKGWDTPTNTIVSFASGVPY